MTEYQTEVAACAARELLRRCGESAMVSAGSGKVLVFGMYGRQNGWVYKAAHKVESLFGLRGVVRGVRHVREYAREQDRKEFAHD